MCVFRYLYMEEPSKTIDGVNVGEFRYELGKAFALEKSSEWKDRADMIIAVPNTGITYAEGMAEVLGSPAATC